jgi:hypothetical protein
MPPEESEAQRALRQHRQTEYGREDPEEQRDDSEATEKAKRKSYLQEAYRKRKANETDEARARHNDPEAVAKRKSYQHEWWENYKVNETDEAREQRLQKARDSDKKYKQRIKANETEEDRKLRSQKRSEYQKNSRRKAKAESNKILMLDQLHREENAGNQPYTYSQPHQPMEKPGRAVRAISRATIPTQVSTPSHLMPPAVMVPSGFPVQGSTPSQLMPPAVMVPPGRPAQASTPVPPAFILPSQFPDQASTPGQLMPPATMIPTVPSGPPLDGSAIYDFNDGFQYSDSLQPYQITHPLQAGSQPSLNLGPQLLQVDAQNSNRTVTPTVPNYNDPEFDWSDMRHFGRDDTAMNNNNLPAFDPLLGIPPVVESTPNRIAPSPAYPPDQNFPSMDFLSPRPFQSDEFDFGTLGNFDYLFEGQPSIVGATPAGPSFSNPIEPRTAPSLNSNLQSPNPRASNFSDNGRPHVERRTPSNQSGTPRAREHRHTSEHANDSDELYIPHRTPSNRGTPEHANSSNEVLLLPETPSHRSDTSRPREHEQNFNRNNINSSSPQIKTETPPGSRHFPIEISSSPSPTPERPIQIQSKDTRAKKNDQGAGAGSNCNPGQSSGRHGNPPPPGPGAGGGGASGQTQPAQGKTGTSSNSGTSGSNQNHGGAADFMYGWKQGPDIVATSTSGVQSESIVSTSSHTDKNDSKTLLESGPPNATLEPKARTGTSASLTKLAGSSKLPIRPVVSDATRLSSPSTVSSRPETSSLSLPSATSGKTPRSSSVTTKSSVQDDATKPKSELTKLTPPGSTLASTAKATTNSVTKSAATHTEAPGNKTAAKAPAETATKSITKTDRKSITKTAEKPIIKPGEKLITKTGEKPVTKTADNPATKTAIKHATTSVIKDIQEHTAKAPTTSTTTSSDSSKKATKPAEPVVVSKGSKLGKSVLLKNGI